MSHVLPQSFTETDIDNMSNCVKKHTLYHLDIARKAFAIQLQQQQQGQTVITQFFPRLTDIT